VALGFNKLADYETKNSPYFGESSGAMETALPKAGSPWKVLPTAWMQTMG